MKARRILCAVSKNGLRFSFGNTKWKVEGQLFSWGDGSERDSVFGEEFHALTCPSGASSPIGRGKCIGTNR
jgi:hypothetical protein